MSDFNDETPDQNPVEQSPQQQEGGIGPLGISQGVLSIERRPSESTGNFEIVGGMCAFDDNKFVVGFRKAYAGESSPPVPPFVKGDGFEYRLVFKDATNATSKPLALTKVVDVIAQQKDPSGNPYEIESTLTREMTIILEQF